MCTITNIGQSLTHWFGNVCAHLYQYGMIAITKMGHSLTGLGMCVLTYQYGNVYNHKMGHSLTGLGMCVLTYQYGNRGGGV